MTALGLIVGLLVAVATAAGGFSGFLLAIVLGVIGLAAGAQLEGRFDVTELLKSRRD